MLYGLCREACLLHGQVQEYMAKNGLEQPSDRRTFSGGTSTDCEPRGRVRGGFLGVSLAPRRDLRSVSAQFRPGGSRLSGPGLPIVRPRLVVCKGIFGLWFGLTPVPSLGRHLV